jgi:MFS superfamily sulfate permease-like transporter
MDLFLGILAAVVLSVLIMFVQSRKLKKSWQGTVTKIKVKNGVDTYDPEYDSSSDMQTYIIIYYKTTQGKKGKIQLREYDFKNMYQGLTVGSILNKKVGVVYPEVVSHAN